MKCARRRLGLGCLLGLLILASIPAQAASPVWAIEKDGRLMFIGGTLHLLTPEDYPLPAGFEAAYRQAERVVFETDMDKLRGPRFQQQLQQRLTYPDGQNLRQVLRADTYRGLVEFFSARDVPMTDIDRYKPGMVVILMTVIELQRLGVVGAGVDDHFNARVSEDGKQKGQLETVAQQIEFIADMGAGNEDAMLSYNLGEIARLPETWRSMTRAWRDGDMATLADLAAKPLRQDFPEIYRSMLLHRNQAWLPQLEALAASQQVELVLVGALHLAGADGLLAALAERGYRIRQLP